MSNQCERVSKTSKSSKDSSDSSACQNNGWVENMENNILHENILTSFLVLLLWKIYLGKICFFYIKRTGAWGYNFAHFILFYGLKLSILCIKIILWNLNSVREIEFTLFEWVSLYWHGWRYNIFNNIHSKSSRYSRGNIIGLMLIKRHHILLIWGNKSQENRKCVEIMWTSNVSSFDLRTLVLLILFCWVCSESIFSSVSGFLSSMRKTVS